MHLESPIISLNKEAQEVFNYLSNVSNFEAIMPENTQKFELINNESFVFALKGMPEIKLKKISEEAPHSIVLGAASDKLNFSLSASIQEGESTQVQLLFDGEFNAMMSMMIKAPLTNFINALIENLEKKLLS